MTRARAPEPLHPLRWRHVLLGLVAALGLAGCPSKTGEKTRPSGPLPCTKFGETCEFSPNKLGACMSKENCSGEHCLFCQSQH